MSEPGSAALWAKTPAKRQKQVDNSSVPEDRVCLRNVGVALELQSGTTFIGILTQWLTRERYDEREDVVSERIDTSALLEALQEAFLDDTRIRAPSHARSATVGLDSLRLEVEIGRYSGNQRWLDASTAPLLRRALNSACEEGLEKDPHYGDYILLCRYVTQQTNTTPSIRSDTEPGERAPFSPARSAAHDKRTEERERDNDVISISSNAHTEPDDGALSDPGGPTTVYDEHEANDGPDALGSITLSGTEEEWMEACRFFRYDPACREMNSGKKLFGTKMALLPGQLRDVWHFLDTTYGTGRTGYISALDTGLGKTMVALGTVAVLRTVDLMRPVCRGDPDTCEVAEGSGYNDCICRSGSLMSKIHQELIPGITVFLTPNSTVQGAQNSADVFLERVVTLPDETKWEFVEVIRLEANKETKEKLFAHKVVDGGNKIKHAKKSSGAGKGMLAKKMSGFDSINTGQLNKNQSAEGLQDSAVSYLDDRQEYPFKERHFLLILPSDASSLDPRHAIIRVDDEEKQAPYEQGYIPVHSYRSHSDNTTSGPTTLLAPYVTAGVEEELKIAKAYVTAHQIEEESKDEEWDIRMVAEYGDEIFAYMRDLEARMLPNAHYMDDQTEIQWPMRSVLMDWLVQVHHMFCLLPETLFLTVNYIDRFLSVKAVPLGKLQLVGATALFVAAKYEDIDCPSVQDIVYTVNSGYSVHEILQAARFMLSILHFELGWPSPISFLYRIGKADYYNLETRTLAKYFLEITILDERFVSSPSSFLAAGAYSISRLFLGKGNWVRGPST